MAHFIKKVDTMFEVCNGWSCLHSYLFNLNDSFSGKCLVEVFCLMWECFEDGQGYYDDRCSSSLLEVKRVTPIEITVNT